MAGFFIKSSNVQEGIQSLLILFFCFLLGRLLLIRSNNFRSPIAVTVCKFYKQIRPDFIISESVQKGVKDSLFYRFNKNRTPQVTREQFCVLGEAFCLNGQKAIEAPSHIIESNSFLLTTFRLDLINHSPTGYGLSKSSKQYP